MRYLLANILYPDALWHINNLNEVAPDIYQVNIDHYAEPTIIKSHEPLTYEYPKVIYVYRDGRDVAVSYYNLFKTAFDYSGSFTEFLSLMLKGDNLVVYGSWQDHVSGWLSADYANKIFYIKYEALCANTFEIMQHVCDFIGIDVNDKMIFKAIEKSAFSVQLEDVKKYSEHYVKGFLGGVKGGPGKWREVFTDETNELFWYFAGELMARLGYVRQ